MKLRSLLLASSTAALLAAPAVAQDAPNEDVVVTTGTRIAVDPNLVLSTPVQSLSEEDIKLSGELDLAEIVNDIPALISSTSTEQSASGGSSLNLRGLGAGRTLTLVNGRRHVAGFAGSSSVDVGTIPQALVERVNVTTGGASAIYGADAVTGVVDFILKDDFEGLEANLQGGVSTHGDAENFSAELTWGKNFDNGRGNITISGSLVEDTSLTEGDRSFSRDNNIAAILANPALRLQVSDLGPNTPNFNAATIGTLLSSFDTAGLTSEEQAIIARINGAPERVVARDPRVWLSSQAGSIAPGFGGRSTLYVDLNNNGIADCQESRGGQSAFLAGCWITNPDGSVSVFEESLIADTSFRGVGNPDGSGSGGLFNFNEDTLYPETDRYNFNLTSNYDLADGLNVYFEGKYVLSESTETVSQDSFYDTLFIQADNPFIPTELLPVVAETGGLLLTQDPTGFITNDTIDTERETIRFVGGMSWEQEDGTIWDFSVNHGRFKNTQDSILFYLDRQFAATDAVRDPATGEIVCRSDLDPGAFYPIDYFTAGNNFANGGYSTNQYYSFTPGDGQCAPLNPFGIDAVSDEAEAFLRAPNTDTTTIDQTVILATVAGDVGLFQKYLAGEIGFAAGFEYRRETSETILGDDRLGLLPQGTPFTPGAQVNTVDPFLNSLVSIDNDQLFNQGGDYDVREAFGELRVPVLANSSLGRELTLDAAIRYAEYSTLGGQTTWKIGGTYAPVEDISFRATISEAVRAPNIAELFDPQLPQQFGSNVDPCDPDNVNVGAAVRQSNCVNSLQSFGVPLSDILDDDGNYIWENPLTGRFTGTTGGNPNLQEETADTFTVGAVLRPRFLPNFSATVDYWDIKIDNGIGAVAGGNILDGCYDSSNFPNVPFCTQFSRRSDGGLNDLTTGQINFAQLEASGFDFAANYSYDWGRNTFGARLVGSYQEKLNRFFNPLDPNEVNPELEEVFNPELSGNLLLTWDRGPFNVGFQTSYQSSQFLAVITAAEFAAESDPTVGSSHFDIYQDGDKTDDVFIFDVNGSYEFSDSFTFYGGVNNIADKDPFATQTAWPVGPRGRFFFVGATYRM